MDGRWSLVVAGLLGGLSGCASTGSRQPAGVPTAPAAPTPPAAQNLPQPPAPPQAAAAPPPRTGPLKPSTHVAMGAMMAQLADDANRPDAERDQYRAQARQAYHKALEVDPAFGPAYLALAQSYLSADEREQATAMLQKAAEVAPNDPAVWGELGTIHARYKNWDAAVDCLTRAAELAPATDPAGKEYAKRLGLTLARIGRAEEGFTALARCMSPAEARYTVARMLQHLGQIDACRQQLQLALRARPDFAPAQELLASLSGAGRPVRQVGYYETASPEAAPATAAASPPPAVAPPQVTAPAQPSPARPAARPAAPKLPPVILGGGAAPVAPVRVGVDGLDD
jgi:Tfp pilus assembly protein PilF